MQDGSIHCRILMCGHGHAHARLHRTALERISARYYVEVLQRLHVDVALSARPFLFYITQIMRDLDGLNGRVASATARPAMPLAMSLSLVSVVSNALRLRRLRIYPPPGPQRALR